MTKIDMGKVVRVGGRGTSRKIIEKPEDNWCFNGINNENGERKGFW